MYLNAHPERSRDGGRNEKHARLRLAYENQMLEAQGGRAASVDMEAGGFVGQQQIMRVNKSPATGRVVSVVVVAEHKTYKNGERVSVVGEIKVNIERLQADIYRAPTDDEREAFKASQKAKKKATPKFKQINPTIEQAEKLQAQFNAEAEEENEGRNYKKTAGEVAEMTQAQYSGKYKDYKQLLKYKGCKIRIYGSGWNRVGAVVVLTDKPQKDYPATVFEPAQDFTA